MKIDIKTFLQENENIINNLFEAREDKLASSIKTNQKELEELKEKETKFSLALDNIPYPFYNTKQSIEDCFYDYVETLNYINSFKEEAYYKAGFVDGVKLIIDSLKNI